MTLREKALILVVDDDPVMRKLLRQWVASYGHLSVEAEDGLEALQVLEKKEIDLVLLDMMMPRMNGQEVLHHLKSDPNLRHIPIVIISAADDLQQIATCIELGAEDYLIKPVKSVILKARIEASLERKVLRDREQRYLQELMLLQKTDKELNSALDLSKTMHTTLNWAMSQTDVDAGFIGVLADEHISVITSDGYDEGLPTDLTEKLFGNRMVSRSLETGLMQFSALADDSQGILPRAKTQIVVPFLREGQAIGLMMLEREEGSPYQAKNLAFLNRLGDRAAVAIANAQLYAAAEDANRAKSEFVSVVSHELRTPMTAIKGYSDLMLAGAAGAIGDTQRHFLETIRDNVSRMSALVSDLVDISRVEAGQLYIEPREVNAIEVMEQVRMATTPQIEAKPQTIEWQIPEALPFLWADPQRLNQVLTNLVINAHKYTPAEGSLTVWTEGPTDGVVTFFIRDTGIGISEADQVNLFQKFYRAQSDEVRAEKGHGLGLSITKYLVEMQGGTIGVHSVLGQGSTFYFALPVATRNLEMV